VKQRIYEIRIEGYLGDSWSPWLRDMTLRHEESGETVITGPLPDEPALHGVLPGSVTWACRIDTALAKSAELSFRAERGMAEWSRGISLRSTAGDFSTPCGGSK